MSPIQNGGFPASYASLPEGNLEVFFFELLTVSDDVFRGDGSFEKPWWNLKESLGPNHW